MKKWWCFEILSVIVVLGTAIDIFWSVELATDLYKNELNPIAKWIIRKGNEVSPPALPAGVALLCGLKVTGTWAALAVCRWLVHKHPRLGWPSLSGLAAFQVWLVWFLCT